METALQVLQARFGGVEAPYLLIFDNVDPESQQTVEALVARLPPSVRVISTARSRDWDAIAKRIELRKLDRDDGAALLRKRADRENDDIEGLSALQSRWLAGLSHSATPARSASSLKKLSPNTSKGISIAWRKRPRASITNVARSTPPSSSVSIMPPATRAPRPATSRGSRIFSPIVRLTAFPEACTHRPSRTHTASTQRYGR